MQTFIKYWPQFLLFSISVLIVWPLLQPGYFTHHDDLQVMRIYEMRKCLEDLQIPCRWVPDMGFGNGFPLFNYYPPFPYYIGAILSYFVGFIGAAKALFAIPLFLGGFTMYLLGRELFDKQVGLVAGVLFLLAPYRALDSYVRGAVAESFAIALIPLIFFFSLRLIRKSSLQNFYGFTLSLGVFLLSHNIMSMLFIPLLFTWIIYFAYKQRMKNITLLIMSLVLGFGLSAFFTIPAYMEKNLVQSDSLIKNDLDFRAHFATVSQLFFDRRWGYGASVWGPNDGMSFQIGWPHWWLVLIAAILLIRKFNGLVLLMIVFSLFSIFMTHNKSAFIWEWFNILQYSQFPWRFLALTIFAASLIGGFVVFVSEKKWKKLTSILIITLTFILNFNYFKPEQIVAISDKDKLSGEQWVRQQKASILDYLPATAKIPQEAAPTSPFLVEGSAKIEAFELKSNHFEFKVEAMKDSIVEVPVFDFPNWRVYLNGNIIKHSQSELGRIRIELPPGRHLINGAFLNTQIRTISNLISLLALSSLLMVLIFQKFLKKYRFKI